MYEYKDKIHYAFVCLVRSRLLKQKEDREKSSSPLNGSPDPCNSVDVKKERKLRAAIFVGRLPGIREKIKSKCKRIVRKSIF